jgi:hypothetical protein
VARSFLESALTSTLPSFAADWDAQRRTYSPGAPPSDLDFLASLRAHVVRLLAEGRVAETSRFLYALERLLADADPVLQQLLERDLIAALAADARGAGIDAQRVEPYLGQRTHAAWTRPAGRDVDPPEAP